jgi:hypothetical protein
MGAGAPLYRSSAGKIKEMSRVEEIERAIEELSPDEFRQVAQRVHDIEAERWDKELGFFADRAAKKWPLRGSRSQESRKSEASICFGPAAYV